MEQESTRASKSNRKLSSCSSRQDGIMASRVYEYARNRSLAHERSQVPLTDTDSIADGSRRAMQHTSPVN